jgi:hypothetical protein
MTQARAEEPRVYFAAVLGTRSDSGKVREEAQTLELRSWADLPGTSSCLGEAVYLFAHSPGLVRNLRMPSSLLVSHFAKAGKLLIVRGDSTTQHGTMDDKPRRFPWLFLPVGVLIVAIGGYWFSGLSPHARDQRFAKDHPITFLAASSAGEAMLQLDACLLRYALIKDDTFPEELEALGPDGFHCVNANLTGGSNNVNYRFAYFPAARDTKDKPHGFLLYAYPLLKPDGSLATDSPAAEYFANEDGLVLVRKDFGTSKEHIEPFLGLPKTLQVLATRFVPSSHLPNDQPGILNALGPEGSPGYSTVPKGYQGLWTPADNDAAVVWTNLSEGYLYSYYPEHGSAPAHFTLLARPVHMGIREVDAPIRRLKHYFLNETGGVHATFLDREADALDPEVSKCERLSQDCELAWVSPPTGSTSSP